MTSPSSLYIEAKLEKINSQQKNEKSTLHGDSSPKDDKNGEKKKSKGGKSPKCPDDS